MPPLLLAHPPHPRPCPGFTVFRGVLFATQRDAMAGADIVHLVIELSTLSQPREGE